MSQIFIKPREGLLVPDPGNGFRPLPPEGAQVEESRYWKRRLADGDVAPARATATPKAPAKAQKS